ncbi:MAG: hypothetical protein ABR958_01875 [Dehalococcoidales bacterium]
MTAISTAEPLKDTPKKIVFRWAYVALPVIVLLIAIAIDAVSYGRLPQDTAYRFSGGLPVSRVSRGGFLVWTLGLQLVFVLISLAIALFITGAARRMQLAESQLNRTIFGIMGNMVALPQIIVAYAMADIFLYNVYGRALPALWAFALAVLFMGGIIMAVLFTRAFVQSRGLKTENTSGSETDVRK